VSSLTVDILVDFLVGFVAAVWLLGCFLVLGFC
jgi:hypothetical protein